LYIRQYTRGLKLPANLLKNIYNATFDKMQHLKIVYGFGNRFPRLWILFVPLIFMIAGFRTFLHYRNNARKKSDLQLKVIFSLIFASLSGLFFAFVLFVNLAEYFETKRSYDQKSYKIVEGRVANYHPMPAGGHDSERFTVNDIRFEFSDYDASDYGYNNTASEGGVIRSNLYVRITYFNNGDKNVILKLESE